MVLRQSFFLCGGGAWQRSVQRKKCTFRSQGAREARLLSSYLVLWEEKAEALRWVKWVGWLVVQGRRTPGLCGDVSHAAAE